MRHYFKVPLQTGKDIYIHNVNKDTKEIDFKVYTGNNVVDELTTTMYKEDGELIRFGSYNVHHQYFEHIVNTLKD